jgi:hypothetical protein
MWIFLYEIVLGEIRFFKKVVGSKRRFEISAGSYEFQRGHMDFSGVNDPLKCRMKF